MLIFFFFFFFFFDDEILSLKYINTLVRKFTEYLLKLIFFYKFQNNL